MKIHYLTFLTLVLAAPMAAMAEELRFGAATVDITPSEPVALDGQRNVRIGRKPETPISVTALALESREGARVIDQAVMVSCDLVAIRTGILEQVRAKVRPQLPDLPLEKIFLSATHTHTAPVTGDHRYALPATGIMQPAAYGEWLTTRVADAVVQAWRSRAAGKVGWGQSTAVIAQNRRTTYADGSAKMYGKSEVPEFRGIEGYEDHYLDALYFWDAAGRLVATAINVACPAQEVGNRTEINADFWHPVRETLRARHGAGLHVLAWNGAGGDQTSRQMYGRAAEERMRNLRGLTRLEELGRRIVNGWEEAYEGARREQKSDTILRHHSEVIDLPLRRVTAEEAAEARREAAKFEPDPKQRWNYLWNQSVVTRYELQQTQPAGVQKMELHVLRLGDVAIATNEFELFTDFGVQMKARSPALQTFVIQLAGSAGYLPTERAVRGGGYSAVPQSSRVGPDGGQVLVERTVAAMERLWAKAK